MNFLEKIFKKTEKPKQKDSITIEINDKIMPVDRWDLYEDPLEKYIETETIWEIVGSGTMQLSTWELDYCDINIEINPERNTQESIKLIIKKLETIGIPKWSKIRIDGQKEIVSFGNKEWLAISLDWVNLDKVIYETCDSNLVISEIKKAIHDSSEIIRYWQWPKETVLYFYADSYEEMTRKISEFIWSYPLCKWAKVEQIA